MQKVKLLVLDLDGTCHIPGGGPHPGNFEAIKKAHDEYGVKVVFATGRPFFNTTNGFNKLGDISKGNYYLAALNGAHIENMSKEQLLEENIISKDLTKWLWNYINKEKRFNASSYVYNTRGVITTEDQTLVQKSEYLQENILISTDVKEFPETYKFMIRHFTEKDKDILEAKGFHVQWEPTGDSAEINLKNIHKGYVVDYFCEKFGIDQSEVLAMGDGSNDVESLKRAGYGICPANSGPAAKAAASRISQYRDDESCVAKTIEELVFNND